jgi:hypothetical protein
LKGEFDLCNQIIDAVKDMLEKDEEVYWQKKPVNHALSNARMKQVTTTALTLTCHEIHTKLVITVFVNPSFDTFLQGALVFMCDFGGFGFSPSRLYQ